MLGTDHDADGQEILAASVALYTHINILQEEKVWNSHRNNYSKKDITIVVSREGALVCDWPVPVPDYWETSVDSSMDQDAP